jgi:iron complex transport system substrate-binding protein
MPRSALPLARRSLLALGLALAALPLAGPAWAERVVVDQIGKTVRLPDTVRRAVVLQHQSLNIAVQLDALGQVVGVLDEWKQQLGAGFARLAPGVETLAMPGGLTKVNIEELIKLKPDVVILTNYAPADMRAQIEAVGLPVVSVSLLAVPPEEALKMNPTVVDEPAAYEAGFRDGVRLVAEVFGKKEAGEALLAAAGETRALVAERLKDVKDADRVRAYMANPDLTTYGRGKYTGLMMGRAGALNVAAASIQGYKQVPMEQIIAWNPAVIFVQDRYPAVVEEIKTSPAWSSIAAVKAGRVYLMPEYAKAWGYPMPEALAIGELWMAKKLYPERFADVDIDARADAYYRRFYRVPFQP